MYFAITRRSYYRSEGKMKLIPLLGYQPHLNSFAIEVAESKKLAVVYLKDYSKDSLKASNSFVSFATYLHTYILLSMLLDEYCPHFYDYV